MARPPITPEQRRAQRQAIYEAAADLFGTKGPGSVTVRAVADRAGVSQGTIYNHFASLGELQRALWAVPVERASRELEQLAESIADPGERIRALLVAFAQFVFDRPDVHRGAMLYVRPISQPQPERFAPEQLAFFRLLTEALEEAGQAGVMSVPEPRMTAELLWAALHGALALPTNADIYELSTSKELAERMTSFVLDALQTPPSS